MAAQKFHRFRFTVMGHGRFPMDMLRYDRCCPTDSGQGMYDPERSNHNEDRTVELMMFSSNKNGPTLDRWTSFGWAVDRNSIEELR